MGMLNIAEALGADRVEYCAPLFSPSGQLDYCSVGPYANFDNHNIYCGAVTYLRECTCGNLANVIKVIGGCY